MNSRDNNFTVSIDAIVTLIDWEDFRRQAYQDSGGALTVGVGHLLSRSERASGKIFIEGKPVRWRDGLHGGQVARLLRSDLDVRAAAVRSALNVPVNQHQFDALVLFTFNVGRKAFRNSTLLRLLNQGAYDKVPEQLRRWVYDNGKVVEGLKKRREAEIKLWNGERP